jgi:C4-dicarboxylate-specific signal transduction histidine kinase
MLRHEAPHLVLLYREGHEPGEKPMQIARGLADLAAIALERAAHIARLTQANAELRASREALARTEKLRALGQMAAGVSHDLKNILNPLSLQAQVVQRAIARGETEKAQAPGQGAAFTLWFPAAGKGPQRA